MKQKKSQITIFLILGFVIVSAFFLLSHFKQQTVTKKLDKTVTTVAVDELKLQEIKNYIQSCIDKTFSDSLELITRQGGFIFDYQNGSLLNRRIPYVEYLGWNISYQILRPSIYPKGIVAAPPLYPCYIADPHRFLGPSKSCATNPGYYICRWSGDYCYFRYNHSQTLNFDFGTEPKINSQLCTYSYSIAGYDCVCSSEPCIYSIQSQLEYYTKLQVLGCLNFSIFPSYNISIGNITTNITISKEDVTLDLKMPVSINLKGYAPTKKDFIFKARQPVRLLQLYALVFGIGATKGLIDYEKKNISFDIVKDGQNLANEFGYIKIEKRKIPESKTSIIIVNDTSDSRLNGKNVLFQFAIENRNPALDYVSQNPLGTYDVFVFKGDEIIFKPVAFDPNEDELLYKYHGWKTDSKGPDDLDATEPDGTNVWESSEYYNNKLKCFDPEKGMQEHVCANYVTTDDDVGEHYVTIEVIDSSGYKDWQTVKIYVNDKNEPKILQIDGCKSKTGSGDYLPNTARGNYELHLQGLCGGDPATYTFIWSFDPAAESPYREEYSKTVSGCVDEINPIFTGIDTIYTIGLEVEDEFGFRTTAPSISVKVYPDTDGDEFCDGQMQYDSPDDYDNCPNTYNPSQQDSDGDKEGDACDCDDGIKGPYETDIDCGGPCPPC